MKTIKLPKGWTEQSDGHFVRDVGPMEFHVYRRVNHNTDVATYTGSLTAGRKDSSAVEVTTAELGIDYFDDKADKLALRNLDRQIKSLVRGWIK